MWTGSVPVGCSRCSGSQCSVRGPSQHQPATCWDGCGWWRAGHFAVDPRNILRWPLSILHFGWILSCTLRLGAKGPQRFGCCIVGVFEARLGWSLVGQRPFQLSSRWAPAMLSRQWRRPRRKAVRRLGVWFGSAWLWYRPKIATDTATLESLKHQSLLWSWRRLATGACETYSAQAQGHCHTMPHIFLCNYKQDIQNPSSFGYSSWFHDFT